MGADSSAASLKHAARRPTTGTMPLPRAQLRVAAVVLAIVAFGGRALTGAQTLTHKLVASDETSACPHVSVLPSAGGLADLRISPRCASSTASAPVTASLR
jgi:hypothetical protein